MASGPNRHVAVSVGSLPCNRPQTSPVHGPKGGRAPMSASARPRPPASLMPALMRRGPWTRSRGLLDHSAVGRRSCHGGIGGFEASWRGPRSAVAIGGMVQGANQQAGRDGGQGLSLKRAGPQIWLSPPAALLQPPAKFPRCPSSRSFRLSPSNPPPLSSGFPNCALIPSTCTIVTSPATTTTTST